MGLKGYQCDKASCAWNSYPIAQERAENEFGIKGEGMCPTTSVCTGGGRLTLVDIKQLTQKGGSKPKLKILLVSLVVILLASVAINFFSNEESLQSTADSKTTTTKSSEAESSVDEYSINLAKGIAASRVENYKEAVDAYRDAIRINPNRIEAFVNLSTVFLKLGKQEDAEKSIRQALEIAAKEPRLHYQLAVILLKKGDTKKSLEALDISLGLGLPDPRVVLEDYDLRKLRELPDFRVMMKKHNIVF